MTNTVHNIKFIAICAISFISHFIVVKHFKRSKCKMVTILYSCKDSKQINPTKKTGIV